jgi:parallel beta-helix repeat protein
MRVLGNKIGTDATGTQPEPNGFGVLAASNDQIGGTPSGEGNIIASSLSSGVWVIGTHVQIEGNSIYSNSGLGIDLGGSGTPVLNDSQGHTGPNNFQDFPLLNSATSSSTSTFVSGTFSEAAEPNQSLSLDFYANSTEDPSGFGQGQVYLGCTLYHLLSGRPPFPRGTLVQKIMAHTERTPDSLAQLRPDLQPGLIRIVERMMAKAPGHRYQTPAEVRAALEPFASPPRASYFRQFPSG